MSDPTIVDHEPEDPDLGERDVIASCPLCGRGAPTVDEYAAHLAEVHGLVDDEGTETRLPDPEPEEIEPVVEHEVRGASADEDDSSPGDDSPPKESFWARAKSWLTGDTTGAREPEAEGMVEPEATSADQNETLTPTAAPRSEPAAVEAEAPRREPPPVRTELVREVQRMLEGLGWRGAAEVVPQLVREARAGALTAEEVVARLCKDERQARSRAAVERRLREANLDGEATLESFDFSFNPKIPKGVVTDLAKLDFLRRREAVVLHGPAGVGKTHLAQAVARAACEAGRRVRFETAGPLLMELGDSEHPKRRHRFAALARAEVLILDNFGAQYLTEPEAEALDELVTRRGGGGGLFFTSVRPPSDWAEIFPYPHVGILDRILHPSQLIELPGKSHRAERSHR